MFKKLFVSGPTMRVLSFFLLWTLLAVSSEVQGQDRDGLVVVSQEVDGRIVEEEIGVHSGGEIRPVAFATVSLLTADGSVVAGSIADETGGFSLTGLPLGGYTLRVERPGYHSVELGVRVEREAAEAGSLVIPVHVEPIGLSALFIHGVRDEVGNTDVLAGTGLLSRLSETVATTLAGEPGLASSGMGVATERPVIRGLGGDRDLGDWGYADDHGQRCRSDRDRFVGYAGQRLGGHGHDVGQRDGDAAGSAVWLRGGGDGVGGRRE